MLVFAERSVLDHDGVCINGGRCGLLVRLQPRELVRVLGAVPVDAAQ